jgi:hypothetical protein
MLLHEERAATNEGARMGAELAAVRAVEGRFYAALRRLHLDPAALGELLAVWSHGDDVSTMNARGGVERGWVAVRDRWTWWAGQGIPMEAERIEHLAFVAGAELAYSVVLEHHATRTLRVTHGYRREGAAWKLVHRHADPLVGRQG